MAHITMSWYVQCAEDKCYKEEQDLGEEHNAIEWMEMNGWYYQRPDINTGDGEDIRCPTHHPHRGLEEDDECPNCFNGTLEDQGDEVLICRGECGQFFKKIPETKE